MLKDFVKDTEHYINILLNEKQNNLLQMLVRLATAGFMICAFKVVIDTFGITINIERFDVQKSGTLEFIWTAAPGPIGILFLYVTAIAWFKYKRCCCHKTSQLSFLRKFEEAVGVFNI
ncbi:Magnesium transporter [Melia azedarach]|uniref:Magnesium transporter n=1 Tax=Melia azedarach TaxID=155640 RepID=A0ACC1XYW3_MELAZ|nr:Magnesium transporter [Melia azedarach]